MNTKRLWLALPLLAFAVFSVLVWFGMKLDPNELPSVLIGKPVPEFALPSLQEPERTLTNADLKGKPYLLNVWATWCPSCKFEHPYLVKLAAEGVPIVGLNYKDDSDQARALLKATGDPYTQNIVDQNGMLVMALGVYGAPETFVIDGDGVVRYKLVGVLDEKVWTEQMGPVYQAAVEAAKPRS